MQIQPLHRTSKAFTFVEVIIATLILSMVMLFLIYLTILESYKSNQLATIARAEMKVRNAAELIRFRVVNGEFGTVVVSNQGHTLEFKDPNLGNVTSKFEFQNGTLMYFDDSSAGQARRNLRGLNDVVFETEKHGSLLLAKVQTQATPYRRPTQTVEHVARIFLRNR